VTGLLQDMLLEAERSDHSFMLYSIAKRSDDRVVGSMIPQCTALNSCSSYHCIAVSLYCLVISFFSTRNYCSSDVKNHYV